MKEFFKNNSIAFVSIILVLVVLLISVRQREQLSQDISVVRDELIEKHDQAYTDLDSKIDRWDNRIATLKKEGYVEMDDFSDYSNRILAATVLVAHASDVAQLSEAGKIVILKEGTFESGVGTGFFVHPDGYIVTAKHVIDAIGAKNVVVRLFSDKFRRAQVVTVDSAADMALLKIEGTQFPFVELGYFENFDIGEEIGFAGYSLNAEVSKPLIHRGVVSVRGVDANGTKLFTVNAFVNKGNSGGPVFSAKTGRVLGMISARQRDTSSERFISLPSNYQSSFLLGGVDPVQFNVELYNKTVKLVGDVSQVGIGVVYAIDAVRQFMTFK